MTLTKGKPAELTPADLSNLQHEQLYVVEAKANSRYPKLGRTPYFMRLWRTQDGDVTFLGAGLSLKMKEVRAVWEIRQ